MGAGTGAAMTADRETWNLFKTDGAGEWEQVRSFERLDEACRCILELEANSSQSIDLTLNVRPKGAIETELELSYKGRRAAYHITNSM